MESTEHITNAIEAPTNCSELHNDQDPTISFIRFIVVVGVGSTLAVMGILANSLLVFILRSSEFRRTNAIFLLVIALLDLTTQLNYLALIAVILTAEYFSLFWLHHIWHYYAGLLFTVSLVVPVAQTYLILAASIDRYLTGRAESDRNSNELRWNPRCSQNLRYATIFVALISAVLLKGIAFWETERSYTGREGLEAVILLKSEDRFPLNLPSYNWFKLWILPVVLLYVPFLLLLFVNCLIVYQLHKVSAAYLSSGGDFINADISRRRLGPAQTTVTLDYIQMVPVTAVLQKMPFLRKRSVDFRKKRRELKGATVMMIILVSSYLIANILNVVISFMEQLCPDYLATHHLFYTFSCDVSSILVIIVCGIRLPVYYTCNRTIREAVWIKFNSASKETNSNGNCNVVNRS